MAEITEDRVREIAREEIEKASKANVGQVARELKKLQDRTDQRLKLGDQQK